MTIPEKLHKLTDEDKILWKEMTNTKGFFAEYRGLHLIAGTPYQSGDLQIKDMRNKELGIQWFIYKPILHAIEQNVIRQRRHRIHKLNAHINEILDS